MAVFSERLGTLYKEFRMEDVGNGRAAFARKLKVTKGQLGGWLDGVGSPDYETLKNLSKILNVSILWLIGTSEDRNLRIDERISENDRIEKEIDLILDFLTYRLGEKGINRLRERLGKNE